MRWRATTLAIPKLHYNKNKKIMGQQAMTPISPPATT